MERVVFGKSSVLSLLALFDHLIVVLRDHTNPPVVSRVVGALDQQLRVVSPVLLQDSEELRVPFYTVSIF